MYSTVFFMIWLIFFFIYGGLDKKIKEYINKNKQLNNLIRDILLKMIYQRYNKLVVRKIAFCFVESCKNDHPIICNFVVLVVFFITSDACN